MRKLSIMSLSFVALAALTTGTGCAGVTVQPGHRALYFDPSNGGIQHEVLQPGWYRTACGMFTPENRCPTVVDFDVTYSTALKSLHALSVEGLPIDLEMTVKYRPIVSELYLLDTEIGPNYFDEVVAPEFNSAATGVFARTSYIDLNKKNREVEDEVEKQLRDRLKGKHIEISSVLIGKISYAPEILASLRERVVSQEQTLRNKQLMENEAIQKKRELELRAATKKLELETQAEQKKMELASQTEQKRLELEAEAEQSKLAATSKLQVEKIQIQTQTEEEKFRIESNLRNKQAEKRLLGEQAQIDRLKSENEAASRVTLAKGEASARIALAKASAEETRATVANVTPMHVMMHAYDALGHLGGTGTTIMLGDWSRTPQFLFPKMPGFNQTWSPYGMPMPMAPAPAPSAQQTTAPSAGGTKLSQAGDTNPY
jgi:regulator of protease activity HflC (stomatin/prohibitin superfamily)